MSSTVCVFGKSHKFDYCKYRDRVKCVTRKTCRRSFPPSHPVSSGTRAHPANYTRSANAVTPDAGCVTKMFNNSSPSRILTTARPIRFRALNILSASLCSDFNPRNAWGRRERGCNFHCMHHRAKQV